ncbi:MAG: glycosyltransferase family 2 protein [Pseudomonadota bacterium]
MSHRPRTLALIPAWNEAPTIRAIAHGALAQTDGVIVVDDGSTDGTAEALEGLAVEVLRGTERAGKSARLAEGLAHAFASGADAVITLDADGQHDPAAIPAFLETATAAPDALILGDRSADMAQMPPSRARWIRFGNFFIGWACRQRIHDAQCGFRLYPRAVWEAVRPRLRAADTRHFVFETAAMIHAADAGFALRTVPVDARYDGFVLRPSRYEPVRDGLRIAAMVTRFLVTRGFRPRGALIVLGLIR